MKAVVILLATAVVLLGSVVFVGVGTRLLLDGESYGGGLIFASGCFVGWWLAGGYARP